MKYFLCVLSVVLSISFSLVQAGELRNWTGSNGKIIEAEFLSFDAATEIVKLKLKDGREQNVKIGLFSKMDQEFVKNGGKSGDNPFGNENTSVSSTSKIGEFEWIFDGKSFDGWEGDMNVWRIDRDKHAMVGFDKGCVFTKKDYDNFIFQCEYKCEEKANNGFMFRVTDEGKRTALQGGTLEIQIADDRGRQGNCTGCLHATLRGPKPYAYYDNHQWTDGWNLLEVIVDGAKIITYVNGMKILDDNLDQINLPKAKIRKGKIGFMGFGSTTFFRNVRIKPIMAGASIRYEKQSDTGFKKIFNGKTLNGWHGNTDKWRVENNLLVNFDPGRITTENAYGNFILRFDFRLSRNTNNGVLIRSVGNLWEIDPNVGFEIQVADDSVLQPDAIQTICRPKILHRS